MRALSISPIALTNSNRRLYRNLMSNLASYSSQATMITHSLLEHNQSYQILHATLDAFELVSPNSVMIKSLLVVWSGY